jgi:signal transduction histidine kinase
MLGLNCDQAFGPENGAGAHCHPGTAVQPDCEVTVCERLWSVTITSLSASDKNSGFVRVMRDVTERHRIRRHLRDAERFASLGQMLFGIAHNVGTPLNIISGYAEFLLMRTNLDEGGHKELSMILDQTRRIAVLLSEALDVARPGQRQVAAIDMKALLADALNLAAHYFRKEGMLAELTCGMSAPLIYGEAPKLRQMFFSLLLNASQNVGTGGRLELTIDEPRDKPGFLSVSLWGVDATGLGHDFSQEFDGLRGEGKEAIESGVGLTLARHILDEAGAFVTFVESEDRGVAIVVHLPVKSPA